MPYPKIRATIVHRERATFTAVCENGTEYQVPVANRSGKGSHALAQLGAVVNLYRRPGEEFWRYRFAGNPKRLIK